MAFSLDDDYIVVTYHYIEDPRSDFSGIHPCSIAEFERQVAFLSKQYDITTVDDVYTRAKTKQKGKACALTFDDGLKDQYENAVPILERNKAIGTFFIITSTLEGIIPSTQKIHLLLSFYPAEKLVDKANEFLEKKHPDVAKKYFIPKDKRLTLKRKMRDDIPTANFKESCTRIPTIIVDNMLSYLLTQTSQNKQEIPELFMDRNDIKDLHKRGHIIGSHSHDHGAFDEMESDQVALSVRTAQRRLQEITGVTPFILCYPHGGHNKESLSVLQKEGITHAVIFNVNREVLPDDDPLLIPRYDTNHIRDYLD